MAETETETNAIRVAMWSGPRNISTAMMRAFGNRPDAFVTDEPLYGHYLARTGAPHPGAADVIAAQGTDWRAIAARLTGPVPNGARIWYQKHMTHHLLPEIDRDWLGGLTNAFLIRDPREMLTSLLRVTPGAGLPDTGLPQQVEIYEWVRAATGSEPPILDSRDVLENPRRSLGLLCEAVGIAFDERMLSWPPGRRETDGVWAPHWYANVEKSTGFEPYRPKTERVPEDRAEMLERCVALYDRLRANRLR